MDLLARRGADRGKRFTYTKDLISITRTIHRDDVITALYGYGKGEELDSGGFGRRITFESINSGKAYVESLEAKEIWGRLNPDGTRAHVFGKVEFDDCEDPEELLQLTTAKLDELSKPLITYQATVVDLKAFGIEHEGVELGDTVAVIDKEFKPELRLKARVVKIIRDLLEPENTVITLGNFIQSIADRLAKQEQYINNFRDKQGVWDRSRIIDPDGINAQYLKNLVDELNARMNSQGGYVYVSDQGKGLITYDAPDPAEATMAIQILGGAFRIANSKGPNGEWEWRTFGDGNGFIADAFIGGLLQGGKVKFDLTHGTLLIGENTNNYLFYFDGSELRLTGTITGATVRTSAGNSRIELSNNLLRSYSSGVMRARLTYDSLDFYSSDGSTAGSISGILDGLSYPHFRIFTQKGIRLESNPSGANFIYMQFQPAVGGAPDNIELGTSDNTGLNRIAISKNSIAMSTQGLINLIASGGIKASGKDVATIEQGTFTPVYKATSGDFSGMTYTTQWGLYIRIGSLVFVQFRLTAGKATIGTASGYVIIDGFPFPIARDTTVPLFMYRWYLDTTGIFFGHTPGNTSYLFPTRYNANGIYINDQKIPVAEMVGNNQFSYNCFGTFVYFCE